MKIKVCHLGKYYAPATGGIESHVRALAQGQADLGFDVTVFCINHRDENGQDVTWKRRAQSNTLNEADGAVQLRRFGKAASISKWDYCPDLRRLAGQLEPFDLVHLHAPNPTMMVAMWGVRLPCPLVITHHSDLIRQRLLRVAYRPVERALYGKAAAILTDSPWYSAGSNTLKRYFGKVQSLPLGIDLAPYGAPAAPSSHADRPPRWLCVGRLVYYKGFETAIRALASVPGELVLVGTGPLRDELAALAEQLGVSERVRWLGGVSDEELQELYRDATAFWFTSNQRTEAFGLVQVEAMASGCPVINTCVPHSGVGWVSPHEHSGLTVPPNDPAELARAALRIWREPGLRERLARNAVDRAHAEFSAKLMAKRSAEIYRLCLEDAKVPTLATAPLGTALGVGGMLNAPS